MQKSTKIIVAVVAAAIIAGTGVLAWVTLPSSSNSCAGTTLPSATPATNDSNGAPNYSLASTGSSQVANGNVIQVVAGENFWGSLVSQLGGNRTSVLSIVSNPNTDPHEYEANATVAEAIANAQFIIVNGVGYDDWALQLIAADDNPHQVVLNVGVLNGVSISGGIVSGNPHMWYNPSYVNNTVGAMYRDLVAIQPSSAGYFDANYAALNASLGQVNAQETAIRGAFHGTLVASTESIFVYLANYTGLDLVSPPEFMKAIAEGNDPPTQSVVQFQCQLESGKVHVLVYNEQTLSPITSSMQTIAVSNNVTVVAVTETVQPPTVNFQSWMSAELISLENALDANALGS